MNNICTDILEVIFKKYISTEEGDKPAYLAETRENEGALGELNYNKNTRNISNISLVCKEWRYLINELIQTIRFSSIKRISAKNLSIVLSRYKNIKNIYFEKCRWFTVDHFTSLENKPKLELLSLDETKLESMKKMPANNIKTLFTRGSNIKTGFDRFKMVEFINCSSSSIIDLYVLRDCKELKILILSFTYVNDISHLILYNTKLEKLDLSFSDTTQFPPYNTRPKWPAGCIGRLQIKY
jgi:Leucine-rich repeat (LRR) protein